MSESRLFPQPVVREFYTGHEDTSQRQYVNELAAHVETIPDLYALPSYYSPSTEEAELLSKYCSSIGWKLEDQGVTPLFRDDIIDPYFCRNVEALSSRASGAKTGSHWYSPAYSQSSNSLRENQTRTISRRWEMFYVSYMRQRRAFHAAFMNALIIKEPVAENVEAIGMYDGSPIKIPSATPWEHGEQTAPDFLYDKTNWVTASLLSALSLPPEQCDAGMKRHAIEQWAAHANLEGDRDLFDFYRLEDRKGPMQLPWSMRSSAELQANHHPQWHQNRIIKQYLGEAWQPRADGLEALLQERPRDYVQVLILRAFGHVGINIKNLNDLAKAAALPPEVKNIIFAEDAAHSTIYNDTPDFPEYGQPTSLIDLIEASHEGVAPQTQETIIEGQRLRIRVLDDELGRAQELISGQEVRIDELTVSYTSLAAYAGRLEAALGRGTEPRKPLSRAEATMLQFGISPAVNDELLRVLVNAVRRDYNKRLHPQSGAETADEERLKEVNNALDEILRARGL